MVHLLAKHRQPLVLLALVATACGSAGAAPHRGAFLQLSSAETAQADYHDGSIHLTLGDSSGAHEVNSHSVHQGSNSARLVTYGGETGSEWNSFTFGTAAPGVVTVHADMPDGVGGNVVDGAWVIASHAKDVTLVLRYTFLDASGRVVEQETGVFPPDF